MNTHVHLFINVFNTSLQSAFHLQWTKVWKSRVPSLKILSLTNDLITKNFMFSEFWWFLFWFLLLLLCVCFLKDFLYALIWFQYCKYLHENLAFLRPVEQSLRIFSEELKDESLTVLVSCIYFLSFAVLSCLPLLVLFLCSFFTHILFFSAFVFCFFLLSVFALLFFLLPFHSFIHFVSFLSRLIITQLLS